MKLMRFDEVIAQQKIINGMPYMVAEKNVDFGLLPFGLFDPETRMVSAFKFAQWAKKRCFPPDRIGADELLAELGLKRYDAWEIIKKTNAVFTGMDHFWIDFGNGFNG